MIEPSAGVDRGVLAILTQAYTVEELDEGKKRIVMKFKPHLAPVKVAVMPLARNKEQIVKIAKSIKQTLQRLGIGRTVYEDTGNIGKAYRRNDEIGTPLCVTVDFDTIDTDKNNDASNTVTIRNRDTMAQIRVPVNKLSEYVLIVSGHNIKNLKA